MRIRQIISRKIGQICQMLLIHKQNNWTFFRKKQGIFKKFSDTDTLPQTIPKHTQFHWIGSRGFPLLQPYRIHSINNGLIKHEK